MSSNGENNFIFLSAFPSEKTIFVLTNQALTFWKSLLKLAFPTHCPTSRSTHALWVVSSTSLRTTWATCARWWAIPKPPMAKPTTPACRRSTATTPLARPSPAALTRQIGLDRMGTGTGSKDRKRMMILAAALAHITTTHLECTMQGLDVFGA